MFHNTLDSIYPARDRKSHKTMGKEKGENEGKVILYDAEGEEEEAVNQCESDIEDCIMVDVK